MPVHQVYLKTRSTIVARAVPLSKQVATVETPNNDELCLHELAEKARAYSKHVEASDGIYQGIDKTYEYANA